MSAQLIRGGVTLRGARRPGYVTLATPKDLLRAAIIVDSDLELLAKISLIAASSPQGRSGEELP